MTLKKMVLQYSDGRIYLMEELFKVSYIKGKGVWAEFIIKKAWEMDVIFRLCLCYILKKQWKTIEFCPNLTLGKNFRAMETDG